MAEGGGTAGEATEAVVSFRVGAAIGVRDGGGDAIGVVVCEAGDLAHFVGFRCFPAIGIVGVGTDGGTETVIGVGGFAREETGVIVDEDGAALFREAEGFREFRELATAIVLVGRDDAGWVDAAAGFAGSGIVLERFHRTILHGGGEEVAILVVFLNDFRAVAVAEDFASVFGDDFAGELAIDVGEADIAGVVEPAFAEGARGVFFGEVIFAAEFIVIEAEDAAITFLVEEREGGSIGVVGEQVGDAGAIDVAVHAARAVVEVLSDFAFRVRDLAEEAAIVFVGYRAAVGICDGSEAASGPMEGSEDGTGGIGEVREIAICVVQIAHEGRIGAARADEAADWVEVAPVSIGDREAPAVRGTADAVATVGEFEAGGIDWAEDAAEVRHFRWS